MGVADLKRLVHVGCRELGLDNDVRRDLQLVVTGKSSMKDMNEADLKKMVDALKKRGFAVRSNGKRSRADRADVRFAHVLWRLLYQAGEAKVAGAAGLNAFIRSSFADKWGHVPMDIDVMRDAKQIGDVINALKSWCARAGVKLGGHDG